METLPLWDIIPDNSRVVSGTAFALTKAGEAYALYLLTGGSIEVQLPSGNSYDYVW